MRLWKLAGCLLVLAGCQAPPERVPVQRLPENGPPLPYAELLTRARAQATAATESFYANRWAEIEDAARALEQTARYLTRAEDVPANRKEVLPRSSELAQEAVRLREAASARSDKDVNASLQRIHLMVRELRLAP
jgi:galactokinase